MQKSVWKAITFSHCGGYTMEHVGQFKKLCTLKVKTQINRGDHPEYVVVRFPQYIGPMWDIENPKVSTATTT
jgi:hypothetical protein